MTIDFKYNIGDVVTHKTMAPPYLSRRDDGKDVLGSAKPQLLTIMGRVADECPGGVQKHYRCRVTASNRWGESPGITDRLIQLHEEELVALS